MTATQRSGSAQTGLEDSILRVHAIFLDGCYVRDRLGTPRFRPVTPHTSDVEKLVVEIAIACEDWLSKAGCGPVWRTGRRRVGS